MVIYYYDLESELIELIESSSKPEGKRLLFITDHFNFYVISVKAD